MSDYHKKAINYIKQNPQETVVVWTKPELAKANGDDYKSGQSILTTWLEFLRANHEHSVADHLEWLNAGNSKAITLPCADPYHLYRDAKRKTTRHWTDGL